MKETMQQHLHTVGQKAIQNVIRHEYGDWPPKSGGLLLPTPPPRKAAAQTAGQKVNLTLQF